MEMISTRELDGDVHSTSPVTFCRFFSMKNYLTGLIDKRTLRNHPTMRQAVGVRTTAHTCGKRFT